MADPLSEDQINSHVQAIHTALAAMVATPKPSYSVGEYSYSWGEYYRLLMDQLTAYRGMAAAIPWQEETIFRDW